MNDAGGGSTGARTEIGFFHEQRIYILKGQFAKETNAIDTTSHYQGRDFRPSAHDLKLLLSIHSGDSSGIISFSSGASFGVLSTRTTFPYTFAATH